MVSPDTIKLLRECDAGIKMGMSSIDEVLPYVQADDMKRILEECRAEHDDIQTEINKLLDKYHDQGKEPNPVVQGMAQMKTSAKLIMNESDKTIASLMTDGSNMGVKSLSKYLNQYKDADAKAKDITKRLVELEEKLAKNMQQFL